ncbi:MAG: Rrf2 family transcriptional regulator [Coriobacteriaceae bacterium]|jgi:Rrf2 family protein|nr:Rrf2 family transcriptional regulator [Coriobacteriaceae bacterium]
MMISTRGRYALRVVLDLAEQQRDTLIPLQEIADRQEISEKYLEGILPVLVREGLLEGARGKGGGYRLTKSPNEYTVGSILKLTEKSLATVSCLQDDADPCPRVGSCKTIPMWQKLDAMIDGFLEGITIADLLKPRE